MHQNTTTMIVLIMAHLMSPAMAKHLRGIFFGGAGGDGGVSVCLCLSVCMLGDDDAGDDDADI